MSGIPKWAEWPEGPLSSPYSIGIEEELMLIDDGGRLSFRGEEVVESFGELLSGYCSLEIHAAVVEVETHPQPTVAHAVAELGDVGSSLIEPLASLGLQAAGAGTHPLATWVETQVPEQDRYQKVLETMRELARREPTMAIHVHVAVPSGASAIAALNGLRERLPLVLALSANSPFWQARDTGLASTRTSLFGAFPRTGLPPYFDSYSDWAERVDVMIRCGAIPEPTFLWWDARLQPRFGTIEVRIADTQSRLEDVAALVALIQMPRQGSGRGRHHRRGPPRDCGREPLSRITRRDRGEAHRSSHGKPCPPFGVDRRGACELRAPRSRASLRSRAGKGPRPFRLERRGPPA